MTRAFQTILIVIFTVAASFGQTSIFKGVVYNKSNNEPLPLTGIFIIHKKQIIASTSTDFDGSFIIANVPSGKFEVVAAKEKYEPITIDALLFGADKLTIKDFYLELIPEVKNEKAVQCNFKIVADVDLLNTEMRLGVYSFTGLTKAEENNIRNKVKLIKGMSITLSNEWLSNYLAEICLLKKNKHLETIEIKKQEYGVYLRFNYMEK